MYLFTRAHGLMHGIAKGILRQDKRGLVRPERGLACEVMLYIRNNRELHTISDFQVTGYYPSIRRDLVRTAFRDAAFELVLKAIKVTDPHPELFDLLAGFLDVLNDPPAHNPGDTWNFPFLWTFYLKFCDLLGLRLTLDECVGCRRPVRETAAYACSIEQGGLVCGECNSRIRSRAIVSGDILRILRAGSFQTMSPLPGDISYAELMRVTRILISYCRYHFEITSDFSTIQFIEDLSSFA